MLWAAFGKTTGDQTTLGLCSTAFGDLHTRISAVDPLIWAHSPANIALTYDVLPFADQVFDQVLGRRLSLSVLDLDRLLSEIARVLKPGGRLLIDDYLAPEAHKRGDEWDARWLNAFLGLRELSVTGVASRSAWYSLLFQAGYQLDDESTRRESFDFGEWTASPALDPANAIRLKAMLVQAPAPVKAFLTIEIGADRIAFSLVATQFRARKRDSQAP